VAVALAALVGALVLGLVMPHLLGVSLDNSRGPIKVGVLHSLSGTMAVSERTVADATLYAIQELNNSGGVLGRKVVPVVVDGRSDWDVFASTKGWRNLRISSTPVPPRTNRLFRPPNGRSTTWGGGSIWLGLTMFFRALPTR
jgi:hypothetical protein